MDWHDSKVNVIKHNRCTDQEMPELTRRSEGNILPFTVRRAGRCAEFQILHQIRGAHHRCHRESIIRVDICSFCMLPFYTIACMCSHQKLNMLYDPYSGNKHQLVGEIEFLGPCLLTTSKMQYHEV